MKAVVVLSGGVDSSTLLYHLCRMEAPEEAGVSDLLALSFDYGQRHRKELDAAVAIARGVGVPHRVVDLRGVFAGLNSALLGTTEVPKLDYSVETQKQTVVPNRNMIFLAVAVAVAESTGRDIVYYGAHKNDYAVYPDCRPEFVAAVSQAAKLGTYRKVGIFAPFADWTKVEIVRQGIILKVPYELTWSCYEGGDQPCGQCGTCKEREQAFALARS